MGLNGGQTVLGYCGSCPLSHFGSNNDSLEPARTYILLPKWEEGLGPQCPKTVCPPLKPNESFLKLHFWNQQTKLHYLHYQLRQYIDFCLDSISSLVWIIKMLYLYFIFHVYFMLWEMWITMEAFTNSSAPYSISFHIVEYEWQWKLFQIHVHKWNT